MIIFINNEDNELYPKTKRFMKNGKEVSANHWLCLTLEPNQKKNWT